MQSDQFASKRVKGQARETTLSQFVHSEDKATTSITCEPDRQIKGLLRSIVTAKVACEATQRSHPSSPVRLFSEA